MPANEKTSRHWADAVAREVLRREVPHPVVCTGISPSGPFHVGHLREIITGDAITRALRDADAPARLLFVVDNADPLRKVYPFLDDARYASQVGRPLYDIPSPGGEGTYDEHFLTPFLAALGRLRVEAEVVRSSELYRSGRMDDVVFTALEKRGDVARILADVTGKALPPEWSPWNPRCPACGRIDRGTVTGFDRERKEISSTCAACGGVAAEPPSAGGKLTWRVDWPARWKVLGVTAEPFGKDHASRGGSYDSGVRLSREVFGFEPPHPLVYEWISLKGRGDMSSSKGNVLGVAEMLEVVPPEVLRYLVLKSKPARSISFDPGDALLRLVDEVDDASARGRDDRALELSRAAGFRPVGVPFKHVVMVSQIAGFEPERIVEMLRRGGYDRLDRAALAERVGMARAWLERFAPADAKIEVPDEIPDAAKSLDGDERAFLRRLAERLAELDDAEEIHRAIRALAAEEGGVGARRGFRAIYLAVLGREAGPRAGPFLASLGPRVMAERLRRVAES